MTNFFFKFWFRITFIQIHLQWTDLFDVMAVGEDHAQSIDSHSPSCGWWQSIFQCGAEILVHQLGFLITGLFVFRLLLKTGSLSERVVQLRVGIANLLCDCKQFKAFGQSRDGTMPFGQGRHNLRMANQEGWIDELALQIFTDQLVQKSCSCPRLCAFNASFLGNLIEK